MDAKKKKLTTLQKKQDGGEARRTTTSAIQADNDNLLQKLREKTGEAEDIGRDID
jgi:hypothetical protein